MRSQRRAAAPARSRSACTRPWPNEMVADFKMPPHVRHGGSASPARTRASARSIGARSPQSRHTTSRVVPWISITRSGDEPALRCRPSTFWVISVSRTPRRSSVTSARCPSFGSRYREPNDGHRALVTLERRGVLDTLITQNVDGLHLKAGSSPERVIEIHGTTREVVCLDCGERAPMERALARVRAGEADPPCRTCGGILKSATISFGQGLVQADLERAGAAARRCDLMLAVGTKLSVYPIAGVVPVAKEAGARVAILNAEPTEMDSLADIVLRGSISALLPRLV